MRNIIFGDTVVVCQANETVLDALLRENFSIPNGCQQGICQSCLMRSIDNSPPTSAQDGLKDTLRKQNFFLACQCYPEQDMTIVLPAAKGLLIDAKVVVKQHIGTDIIRLVLGYQSDITFFAGQFVHLTRADGLNRCYSIANLPHAGKFMEFHIRRLANGVFSNWIFDELAIGDSLTITEPQGACHYLPDNTEQPLLLVATGTGLAVLWGIVQDALSHGHQGDIHLFHGSRSIDGLYFIDELRELTKKYPNIHYTPCLSGNTQVDGFSQGRVNDVALTAFASLKGWRVYLCGNPDMVKQFKMQVYLKGAALTDIYADAFFTSSFTGN